MFINRIRKKFRDVPDYVGGCRFLFGLRLLFKRFFNLPVIIKTKRGSWIFLGTDKIDDIILRSLYQTHQEIYFPMHLGFKEHDIILDIGAHHGIYAMEFTSEFPGVRMFSFEPDKTSFRYLTFNRFLNSRKNVFPINAALENETGNAFLVRSDEGSWGNYVTKEVGEQAHKITMISSDDFLKKYKIKRIVFAKLNAEGAEFSILPNLFELNIFPETILLFGHPEKGDLQKLIEIIESRSYRSERIGSSATRPWYMFHHYN